MSRLRRTSVPLYFHTLTACALLDSHRSLWSGTDGTIASACVRLDNIDLIGCVGDTAAAKPPYARYVGKFFGNSASAAAAGGSITSMIPGVVYAVHLQHLFLPLIIEIGFGVHIEHDKSEEYLSGLVGGVFVRVNGNGAYRTLLLDSSGFNVAGPAETIIPPEGRPKILSTAEHREVVERFHTACLAHIPQEGPLRVLDESRRHRDHHRWVLQLLKKRVAERGLRCDSINCSGVVSAVMALSRIAFALEHHLMTHRREQRTLQLASATNSLTHTSNRIRSVLLWPHRCRSTLLRNKEKRIQFSSWCRSVPAAPCARRLRGGSSSRRVYKGAVALACDGRLCDLAREVAMEPLTVAGAGLPRRDACTSPVLDRERRHSPTRSTLCGPRQPQPHHRHHRNEQQRFGRAVCRRAPRPRRAALWRALRRTVP
ncbi:hypothetical protein LdCL_080013000 [Leishmania donovani]|uniref:Uncharacterized protein n=2 Tax=Leishmania donovani TaxID=5661 RepID=A0A3S7WQC8_LEIDO|nr:hypothetical protein LdCL_080013000 [Leishmania donovani]